MGYWQNEPTDGHTHVVAFDGYDYETTCYKCGTPVAF